MNEKQKQDVREHLAYELRLAARDFHFPPWRPGEGRAYIDRCGFPFPIDEEDPRDDSEEKRWKTLYFLDDYDLTWQRMKELSGWLTMEDGRLRVLMGIDSRFKEGSNPPESELEAAGYENHSADNAPQTAEEWRYINQRVRVERKTLMETCLRALWDHERIRVEELRAIWENVKPVEQITQITEKKVAAENHVNELKECIRKKDEADHDWHSKGGKNRAAPYCEHYSNIKKLIYEYLDKNPFDTFTHALEEVCHDYNGASESAAKKNIKKSDVIDKLLEDKMRKARSN